MPAPPPHLSVALVGVCATLNGTVTAASQFQPHNSLIAQGDHTVLVEVDNPIYPRARDALARFAELVKSPEEKPIP